jgi:hypothetical protein
MDYSFLEHSGHVPVQEQSNFSAKALQKTARLPIKVTESIARASARSGDYGDDSTYHHPVAPVWKHNGGPECATPGVSRFSRPDGLSCGH